MNNEEKIEILERILKAVTYADEIRYPDKVHDAMLNRVQFVGANPDFLHLRGYSEGLEIDWDAEYYESEVPEEFGGGTTMNARLVGEVWVGLDMWKTIQDLRKQLSQFIEKGEKNE